MSRLGDFVKIHTGKLDANASSPNGKYPFFTCAVEPLKIDSYSYDCECVLLAGNGDLNVKYYNGKFDAYQRTYVIESLDKEKLLVPYLYYFMERYVETLRRESIGGVIKYIKLGNITEAEINVPDLDSQTAVIERLRKLDKLFQFRKRQLAKLDELVKARFVEMFGDPIKNTQKRPVLPFFEVVTMQRGFDLPINDRDHEGKIPVFGSNGILDYHNIAKIQGGGVITGRSGTIGKVYYTENDYWPLNTTLFSANTHGNNIVYLSYLLELYNLSRFAEGSGVPTLNRNVFHYKPIINIPLLEQ